MENLKTPNKILSICSPKILIMGFASFVIFFLYRSHYCTGDALIYGDNILRNRFGDISIHIGYYFLGFLFHKVFGIWGTPIDVTLILMSNILGAIGLVFAYLLLEKLLGDRKLALLGSLIFLFSGTYLYYATSAEVYVPQTAFILASMYYFLINRFSLSGILFAVAVLITPLSIFVSPFFIFFHIKRMNPFKMLFNFILFFALVYFPVFFFVYGELLWGRRGLLRISSIMPYVPIMQSIYVFAYGSIKSFNILSFFALFGYIYLFIKDKAVFLLVTIMLLSQVYLIIKTPVPSVLARFLLPIHIYFCLIGSVGLYYIFRRLIRNIRICTGCLITTSIIYISLSLFIWIGPVNLFQPRLQFDNKYKDTLISFDQNMEENAILIASFWDGVAFAYYTRTDISEELEATMGNKRWMDIDI